MNPEAFRFRISDYFWPLGVSLFGGCFGLYLFTLGLFALGVSITPWHGLAFAASAILSAYAAFVGQKIQKLKNACFILFLQLMICGLLTGIAGRLDELTVDGMQARIEPVINLMGGWNPVKDREFSKRAELEEKNPFLKGGHNYQISSGIVLAGYLASLTGNVNAGKAVTPILGLATFGVVFGGLLALRIPRGWTVLLTALAAANPVILYQSSSYYIDGHVGALYLATLFAGIRALAYPAERLSKGLFFVCMILMAGSKTSGLFYGGILCLIISVIWVASGRSSQKQNILIGSAGILLIAVLMVWVRGSGGLPAISHKYIKDSLSLDKGSVGYERWAPGLGGGGSPGRWGIFFNSHFSPTAAMASEPVSIKFPFWFDRPELAVFEDISPQPCAGGFGPLYGAFFVLSALSLLLLRTRPPLISWLPLLGSVSTIYFSQLWWARWTPQAWLIPFGFLLPVICSFQGQPAAKKWILPFVAAFVGLLNSILILAFYTSGCIQAQRTLDSQLEFLKSLPQPLRVYMPDYPSNRIFFVRDHMTFETLQQLTPRPRLKLHRTSTEVALPAGTDPEARVSPAVWKNWSKRNLIEL
jgi:hypothetical protein